MRRHIYLTQKVSLEMTLSSSNSLFLYLCLMLNSPGSGAWNMHGLLFKHDVFRIQWCQEPMAPQLIR